MRGRSIARMAGLLAAVLVLIGTGQAWALGTEADQTISNTASVQFTINGSTTTKNSNQEDLKVDRKVLFSVTSNGDAYVVAGINNYVLPFTVTNESNTKAGTNDYFQLTITGGADDFDMNNVRLYLDVNNNGTFEAGTDTLLFTGLGGAAYVQINKDSNAKYLIVADCPAAGGVPDTGTPNLTADYNLVATAWAGNNAGAGQLLADGDGNDKALSEVVYADLAGTADAPTDGIHSDEGTYTTLATIGVTKAVDETVYHIPGNVVPYDITVTNGDPTYAATNVIVTDNIPVNTTYESFLAAGCNGTREWNTAGGWVAAEPATKSDVTGIRCTILSIASGASETVTFSVTIN